ncbi:MAG: substrate-binding domain-containing protein, partial [Chloroflexi bacterium]|nr:substrate-binding domain-containing protein [Chloroflexota bacterium]
QGLSVPKDMSVIGFDDAPLAERIAPALTTVRQPLRKMGLMAAQMLLRMISGETLETKRIELTTSLVIRESCAPPSVKNFQKI